MNELVKINAKDYGLEESKAKQISDMFKPMLDLVADLEKVRHYKFESESYQKMHSDLIDLIEKWIPVIN